MPLPLALIPAGLGAIKAIQGVGQGMKAKKLEKGLVRPDAVSKEEKQVLGQMGQMAYGGVPGEQQARENIGSQSANAMAALGQATNDPNKLLNAISQTQVNQTKSLNELNADVSQQKLGMLQKYLQAKSDMGATEQADKMQQFEDKAATISALKAAGRQNVMTGLQDIGGAAIAGAGTGVMGGLGGNAATTSALQEASALAPTVTATDIAKVEEDVLNFDKFNSVSDIANNTKPNSLDWMNNPNAKTSTLDLQLAKSGKKRRRLF